uniref:C2H2-type domain-containing protein n=1 Tax=Gasterosteus aculeatus aculeatus TaxID=481459 RepID=A0AAQ4PJT2_GASAC
RCSAMSASAPSPRPVRSGFTGTWALKTHMLVHGMEKPFMCDLCGKTFFYNCQLQKHQQLVHDNKDQHKVGSLSGRPRPTRAKQHSGDRPHVCSICQKGFLLMSQLKQHELLHSGVKPHKCEECSKEFRTPQNYHRHLLIHTGEKPYECVVCNRKFRQSNQLKSHMQIHTGVKLYTCEHCGQGFSDSRQLKKHQCDEHINQTNGSISCQRPCIHPPSS